MAEHSIWFKIGSIFKGEGFQKAVKTTKTMGDHAKRAAGVASQLAGALGTMDSKAAQAANGVAGMVQGFIAFGVAGAAMQVVILAVTAYMKALNEKVEKVKKEYEELRKAEEKAFNDSFKTKVAGIQKEIGDLTGDFERLIKQTNDFTAALNGLRGAQNQGGILALEVEKMNALLAAHGEAERQAIEQTYALKIAMEKAAIAQEEGALKIEAANAAIEQNTQRQAKNEELLDTVYKRRVELEGELMLNAGESEKRRQMIQKELDALKEQEKTLTENQMKLSDERLILDQKLLTVKQEAQNLETQANLAVDAVRLKNTEIAEAKEAEKYATMKATQETELKTAAEMTYTGEIKSAAEIQMEANAAARSLAAAQKEYEAKLKEYNSAENLTKRASQESVAGVKLKNGLLPVDVQKGIQMTVADQAVDDAIRNGAITTVKEADNLQRQAMREARDAISKNQRQQIAEAKRYERLKELNPKALASADREFMAKYEKLLEHQRNQKEDLKKSKDKMEEAAKELKNINTKLKDLGLK